MVIRLKLLSILLLSAVLLPTLTVPVASADPCAPDITTFQTGPCFWQKTDEATAATGGQVVELDARWNGTSTQLKAALNESPDHAMGAYGAEVVDEAGYVYLATSSHSVLLLGQSKVLARQEYNWTAVLLFQGVDPIVDTAEGAADHAYGIVRYVWCDQSGQGKCQGCYLPSELCWI